MQHESERLTKPNNASAADEKDSAEVPSAKRAKADSSSATTATTTAATTTSTTSSTAAATASTAEQQGEKTLQEKLARGRNERVQTQAWDKSVVTGATVAERQVAQIAKPSKFDEKAVMSAKERYLARKVFLYFILFCLCVLTKPTHFKRGQEKKQKNKNNNNKIKFIFHFCSTF